MLIITAKGFQNVTGGKNNDFFVINDNGSLAGEIDGGLGNNVLSYASTFTDPFTTPAREIELTTSSRSGLAIPHGRVIDLRHPSRFENIEAFIGGKADDKFTNKLSPLTNTRFAGGDGNDTYIVTSIDALTKSTVVENPDEGTDTIDLSAVTVPLEVDFRPQTPGAAHRRSPRPGKMDVYRE